jgi:hypothetical protein
VYDLGALAAWPLRPLATLPFDRLPSDMGYPPLLAMQLLRRNPSLPVTELPISWGEAVHSNVILWRYGLSHLARLTRLAVDHDRMLIDVPPRLSSRRVV